MTMLQNDIEELNSFDSETSDRARQRWLAQGQAALEPLIAALSNANDQLRWKILLLLCEIGDNRAIPVFIDSLHSSRSAIQAAAAQFLGNTGDPRAAAALRAALKDYHSATSPIWIIQALGKLRDREAVDLLIRIMSETDSAAIRYTAIEALGLIGDRKAIEPIRRYANDESHHVRARVSVALELLSV
jgi:HEAT repeat protein